MIRALAASLAAGLLLASPATALADGLALPFGDTCWGGTPDADADGLDDDCEQALAVAFQPKLWFDSGESGYGRRPYFAVKNQSFAARTVQIFYLDAFYDDTGVTTGHDGDPEFQLFEVHFSAGKWLLDSAYLSAHRKSVCDSSDWYAFDRLEYDTASDPQNAFRGRPTLYVAEDKHATYPDLGTCDDGCFFQDFYSRFAQERLDTSATPLASRNVGSTQTKLINKVVFRNQTEFLLDDVEFKGWDNQWYRANSEGYRRHLDDFGF
jgi:hypothetical protein